jgi:plastocyanin
LIFVVGAPLAAAVIASGPSAAAAPVPAKVSITEKGFSPAVVVVATGTRVRWTNRTKTPHSLSGHVSSPSALRPGATYQHRFTTPGEYTYFDGRHPNSTGTVVVITAGSSRPAPAPGNATYQYSARLTLSVDENWTYYDSACQCTDPPCEAQIGKGERVVNLTVRFPKVTYIRNASVHVESLYSSGASGRFGKTTETIKSLIATSDTPQIKCDGGEYNKISQPADCHRDFTGKPVLLDLSWGSAIKNTFLVTNSGPEITPSSCQDEIDSALNLVGAGSAVLPLNLVGARVAYDDAQTDSATRSEVSAMRAGSAFTVIRSVDLKFTTPCCDGFNGGPGGIWARTGTIRSYKASLTIRFTPGG